MVHLETRPIQYHVALRPVCSADSVLLDRWRLEPSIRRHQPLTEASVSQLRADLARQNIADLFLGRGEKFQWIIEVDSEPAGWITLVVTNWAHGLAEIGYALSTPFQRRGIMPRALDDLLNQVFTRTQLRRLEARCSISNVGSYRVLERVGFRREGTLRGYFLLDGRAVDNYLYAILRSDVTGTREPRT